MFKKKEIVHAYSLNYIKTFHISKYTNGFEELIHVNDNNFNNAKPNEVYVQEYSYFYQTTFRRVCEKIILSTKDKKKKYNKSSFFETDKLKTYKSIYIVGIKDEPIMMKKIKNSVKKLNICVYYGIYNQSDYDIFIHNYKDKNYDIENSWIKPFLCKLFVYEEISA